MLGRIKSSTGFFHSGGLPRVGARVRGGRINHLHTGRYNRGRLLSEVQDHARPGIRRWCLFLGRATLRGLVGRRGDRISEHAQEHLTTNGEGVLGAGCGPTFWQTHAR